MLTIDSQDVSQVAKDNLFPRRVRTKNQSQWMIFVMLNVADHDEATREMLSDADVLPSSA
jgi:hypothetical protein